MEYYLNRLNVILIVLVGGLCVWQWSGEKQADGQIEALRQAAAAAERHLAAQDQAIRGANEDIDEFKKIVTAAKSRADAADVEIRGQKGRIFTLEQEEKRRAAEVDYATKAIAAYKQGVAARDANIKTLLDQRQQLVDAEAGRRFHKADQAVTAYNELASKYESLVGQYNDLAKRYKALTTPPPTDKDKSANPGA